MKVSKIGVNRLLTTNSCFLNRKYDMLLSHLNRSTMMKKMLRSESLAWKIPCLILLVLENQSMLQTRILKNNWPMSEKSTSRLMRIFSIISSKNGLLFSQLKGLTCKALSTTSMTSVFYKIVDPIIQLSTSTNTQQNMTLISLKRSNQQMMAS